jgi:dihydropyrimidinase
MTVSGHADTVISRGQVIVDNNQYLGRKGHGKFQKRGLSQYLT